MEACAGAHHWARELQAQGFLVKLIAPQFVKPYVKSNKNDANDAEAICEAMSRPTMRFVAVKSVEQQDIQAVHRIRSELLEQRTAKANQIRGLVGECCSLDFFTGTLPRFFAVKPTGVLTLTPPVDECWKTEQTGKAATELPGEEAPWRSGPSGVLRGDVGARAAVGCPPHGVQNGSGSSKSNRSGCKGSSCSSSGTSSSSSATS